MYRGYGKAIAVDRDGNVTVTSGSTNGSNWDYHTAKFAASDGSLLWRKLYDGPGHTNDYPSAVAVDSSGNVFVTGQSYNTGGIDFDYYTANYSGADGALLWETRYAGPAGKQNRANALAVDHRGDVVVTGSSQGTNANWDCYTAKYSGTNGVLIWERRYNGPANRDDHAIAVVVNSYGDAFVAGYSGNENAGDSDFYTAKYSGHDGTLLWEKRYDGPAHDLDRLAYSSCLALCTAGSVAVAGGSKGFLGSAYLNYATVVYREVLPPVSIEIVPAGVRLSFAGDSGVNYRIERAPSVAGPWDMIATPVASAIGFVEFVDTNYPPVAAYYRTSTR